MDLNDTEYLTAFEKLQTIKDELYQQNKSNLYHEDDKTFVANNFTLAKRHYKERSKHISSIKRLIEQQNKRIISMKGLYVMSRSNKYERELKDAFEKRKELLNTLGTLTGMSESVLFYVIKKNTGNRADLGGGNKTSLVASSSFKPVWKKFRCLPKTTKKEKMLSDVKKMHPKLVKKLLITL